MKVLLLLTLSFSLSAKTTDLEKIYKKFDKDNDQKITIEDGLSAQSEYIYNGETFKGMKEISALAQELAWASKLNREVDLKLIKMNPVERTSHLIKHRYWDGLTRRIDPSFIDKIPEDTKVRSKENILYFSSTDTEQKKLYKDVKTKVTTLPEHIPDDQHGLLALAMKDGVGVPYVVPGGRFNEMYGWDSYFHVLGTLNDGRVDLAKGMVDNFVYEINHYGKILNANRSYYLTRSQPPFLTSMIKEVLPRLPENPETKKWLEESLRAAIKEYKTVWMGEERLTSIGLNRYAGIAPGIPPEVEPGHFDNVLKDYSKKHKLSIKEFSERYDRGLIKEKKLDEFFNQDRAMRESGHDTTYRFQINGVDRTLDFVTVDLNSLLYKYEKDISTLIKERFDDKFDGESSAFYDKASEQRKLLMKKYLWNQKSGMFFDYNYVDNKLSDYISATAVYPLWAGLASKEEAELTVKNSLKHLEQSGGLSSSAKTRIIKTDRQWDYPNGWAPHQILAWYGFLQYGYNKDADRLIYKWLSMITKNARDYNGTVPEKFNVVTNSHKVFAEYGNVGTKFSYITTEGFGWMNASYQLGLTLLSAEKKKELLQAFSD